MSGSDQTWNAIRAALAEHEAELQTAMYKALAEALNRLRQRLQVIALKGGEPSKGATT